LNLPMPKPEGSPLALSRIEPRLGEQRLELAFIGLVALAAAIANGLVMGLGLPVT
jgi:hypothetical protein